MIKDKICLLGKEEMDMEGFWFFWSIWLIIIGVYFFDSNKSRKEKNVFLLLLLIGTSGIVFSLGSLSIRMPFVILAILCFYQFAKFKWQEKLYCYFVIILLSGAYFLIQYFIYFEPVWLYVSPLVTICTISSVMAIVFMKNQKKRLLIVTAALIQGEMFFIFSLWEKSHSYFHAIIIGDFLLLDMFSLSMLIVVIWNGLEYGAEFLRNKWAPYPSKPVGHGKLNA